MNDCLKHLNTVQKQKVAQLLCLRGLSMFVDCLHQRVHASFTEYTWEVVILTG